MGLYRSNLIEENTGGGTITIPQMKIVSSSAFSRAGSVYYRLYLPAGASKITLTTSYTNATAAALRIDNNDSSAQSISTSAGTYSVNISPSWSNVSLFLQLNASADYGNCVISNIIIE